MSGDDPRRFLVWLAPFTCIASALSCAGDGGGLTPTGDRPTSGLEAVQPLFDRHCTRCHTAGGIGYVQTGGDDENGLDLTAGRAFDSLVNRPTFEEPGMFPIWRVRPEEPDSSYLLQKINSDTPKSGRRMPLDGPPFLSDDDVDLIRAWIEDGAPGS
jgi:mono/diheme cytochrome c family protein